MDMAVRAYTEHQSQCVKELPDGFAIWLQNKVATLNRRLRRTTPDNTLQSIVALPEIEIMSAHQLTAERTSGRRIVYEGNRLVEEVSRI